MEWVVADAVVLSGLYRSKLTFVRFAKLVFYLLDLGHHHALEKFVQSLIVCLV
jgi:hypothetical protein